jgi:hypothetical protein
VTRRKGELATGSSSVGDLLAEIQQPEPATESLLELEVRRELYAIAAETVRGEVHPDTWRALELTVWMESQSRLLKQWIIFGDARVMAFR